MKIIKKRNYFIIALLFVLAYFFILDFKELIKFYNFDVNAPDLTADGVMLRNKFFISAYEPAMLFPNILGMTILIAPLMTFVALYYYNKIKKKCLMYVVGKSNSINNYILKLKFKVAFMATSFFYIVYSFYILVSYILTNLSVREHSNFDNHFGNNNLLSYFNSSVGKYIFISVILVSTYIMAITLLLTTIQDYGYNYIAIFIAYIIVVYVANDFIFMYISRGLTPLGSMIVAVGLLGTKTLYIFSSYIYMVVIYTIFRLTHRKEF